MLPHKQPFALSQVSPAYARQGASSEQIYTLFGHCLTIFHILQVFDRYTNKKLFVESLSRRVNSLAGSHSWFDKL